LEEKYRGVLNGINPDGIHLTVGNSLVECLAKTHRIDCTGYSEEHESLTLEFPISDLGTLVENAMRDGRAGIDVKGIKGHYSECVNAYNPPELRHLEIHHEDVLINLILSIHDGLPYLSTREKSHSWVIHNLNKYYPWFAIGDKTVSFPTREPPLLIGTADTPPHIIEYIGNSFLTFPLEVLIELIGQALQKGRADSMVDALYEIVYCPTDDWNDIHDGMRNDGKKQVPLKIGLGLHGERPELILEYKL